MGAGSLVLVNLMRNKRRTFLTFGSVAVALFLFSALGGILDTLQESIKVGSETRLVARNAVSLIFPLPMSYRDRLLGVPGVKSVALQNWFGGQNPQDAKKFFAQFAVDAETFFPMYAGEMEIVQATPAQSGRTLTAGLDPKLASFMEDRTGCIVGRKLLDKFGWKLGQTITLSGTIYPGDWPLTIHGVYTAKKKSFGEETVYFHFKYLDEKGMDGRSEVGVYVLELTDPTQAAAIARQVDQMFENSSAATRTESEQAFQAGFVSMYGNIPFVLRVIGMAVVFAILLIAANTMVMAVRERTAEIGVLKTLGFDDGTIFRTTLLEGALIATTAGALGAFGAKLLLEGTGFNFGGFIPPMSVYWRTVLTGVAIAAAVGAVSGVIPAWQASRLRIVDALRRVE